MDKRKYEYLCRLAALKDATVDKFDKTVFDLLCRAYQAFLLGKRADKFVSKEELLKTLSNLGLLTSRTPEKLPDDRKLRNTCRSLLKRGYPIMATSTSAGYFIADSVEEMQKPMNENHKRALEILAAERGYKRSMQFMLGQLQIGGDGNG